MPTPIPNKPSGTTILARTPRPTDESSRQIFRTWDERIKEQATFSARTTNEAYLESVRKVLAAISSRQISPQDGERNLRSALQNLGYRPEAGFPDARGTVPPATPGSIRDLSSSRRIQLIIDTNVKQARSLGQVATSEDPKMLMTAPAWKLTRTGARKKPRGDWRRRWTEAGKACNWYGASRNQMVALKTSPIWQALANGAGGFRDTLGSPFPPFAFGSGMAWVNVDWDDWEELCRREGIPDHLDDITKKAKELKAAKSGQIGPSKAATVAPTVQPDGNRGRVGAVISPLSGQIGPQPAVPVRTTPVKTLFKPDLSARLRADKAVDDGIAAIRRDAQTVAECTQGINDQWENAKKAVEANPAAADRNAHRMAVFERYAEVAVKAAADLKSLEGRVVNYGASVAATPRPTENGQQGPYNAKMQMVVQATAKTVRDAHAAAVAARLRLNAASKTAEAIIKDAEAAEDRICLDLMESVRPVYEGMGMDYYRENEAFLKLDKIVPDKSAAFRIEADRFRNLKTELDGIAAKAEAIWHDLNTAANAGDEPRTRKSVADLKAIADRYAKTEEALRTSLAAIRKFATAENETLKRRDAKVNRIVKLASHPEVVDDPEVKAAFKKVQESQDGDEETFAKAYGELVAAADRKWKPVTKTEIATNAAMEKIGAKHTVADQDASTKTNPNYGHDSYKGQWSQNCQRCVPCAELIRRGYKVTVQPLPRDSDSSNDHLRFGGGWKDAFVGGTPIHFKSKADAERIILSWGEGARAELCVKWKGRQGSGHVFLAEVVDGKVEFICPQTGTRDYDPWYAVATRGRWANRNSVMRIDNLEPNPRFLSTCCRPD